MPKLLVVDDEQSICWGLCRLGEKLGHEMMIASSAEQAMEIVQRQVPDLIILDVRLPGLDGLSAMRQLRKYIGEKPIIIITAYGDLQTAVRAVQNGASEYLVKPFDAGRAQQAIQRALHRAEAPRTEPVEAVAVEGFVGQTPIMHEAFHQIALAAASDTCVLLQGESGTGKELAARAIHKYSARASGPFVVVNVASLSSSLAESELFGHVRGSFTGADQSRGGLLARADGGTLFLDEIADIPVPTQVKLLRALDHGEVMPVGSDEPVKSDFRVVSATHQDLQQLVQEGIFRHDLYFRLSAFGITLPPLRERRADIVPLAEHFLDSLSSGGRTRCQLSDAARRELEGRPWVGNVRELRNAVEHAVILARGGTIMPEHLPDRALASLVQSAPSDQELAARIQGLLEQWTRTQLTDPEAAGLLYDQLLALVEPPVLSTILESQAGQFAASARLLGLHRTTLRKKMEQYALDRDA